VQKDRSFREIIALIGNQALSIFKNITYNRPSTTYQQVGRLISLRILILPQGIEHIGVGVVHGSDGLLTRVEYKRDDHYNILKIMTK